MRNKILSLLVLLLTAATGAWAETVFEFKGSTADPGTLTLGSTGMSITTVKIHNNTDDISGIKMGNDYVYDDGKYFTIKPATGSFKKGDKLSIAICYSKSDGAPEYAKAKIFAADHTTELYTTNDGINGRTSADDPVVEEYVLTQDATELFIGRYGKTAVFVTTLKVVRTPAAPEGPVVNWDPATKTGTFTMPAYDVEIAPIYAPKAVFATDGNLVLTPTAIEGVYAESTDAIVKAGTVAKIGETEDPQGIVMYAVTSTNQATAPALTAFSADVPTAKDITIGSEVLVWYYIKGADTPQGQDPSAENTFNDSEICTTPITVNVLSNKFDIQFNAANANTIEAGKATVKVGDAAATVTDGKIEKVKMGSKVTITAKDGYKFRKAEGKKGKVEVFTVEGQPFYFIMGENWQQAIESHPTENANWIIDGNRAKNNNGQTICYEDSGDPVELTSEINPKTQYTLRWGF